MAKEDTMREVLVRADQLLGEATSIAEQIRATEDSVLRHDLRVQAKHLLDGWGEYREDCLRVLRGEEDEESLLDEKRHCDHVVDYGRDYPKFVRWFLFINRLPAGLKWLAKDMGVEPRLWGKHGGKWWRVVTASRLGDIGITTKLDVENGYEKRVYVDEVTDFTDERPKAGS